MERPLLRFAIVEQQEWIDREQMVGRQNDAQCGVVLQHYEVNPELLDEYSSIATVLLQHLRHEVVVALDGVVHDLLGTELGEELLGAVDLRLFSRT